VVIRPVLAWAAKPIFDEDDHDFLHRRSQRGCLSHRRGARGRRQHRQGSRHPLRQSGPRFERRFARLEERIIKETIDLKEDVKNRVEALELYTKREMESLMDRLRAEHDERVDSDASLGRRITTLDEQTAKSQRELRQQILEQHQRLSDDIRKKMDEVLAALAHEAQTLRSDKADRATLAACSPRWRCA
jgi:hypothetical protein